MVSFRTSHSDFGPWIWLPSAALPDDLNLPKKLDVIDCTSPLPFLVAVPHAPEANPFKHEKFDFKRGIFLGIPFYTDTFLLFHIHRLITRPTVLMIVKFSLTDNYL
jgi:hypothetical protein